MITVKERIAEQQQELIESMRNETYDKKIKRFCFKHNFKRWMKKIKPSEWGLFIIVLSLATLTLTTIYYEANEDNTDWIAQKQPVSEFISISNGNDTTRVHQGSMIAYTPIWNDNGSLECYYVLFTYQGSRITLELTDNEAGTMEEWKESIEACFPVGGSNE